MELCMGMGRNDDSILTSALRGSGRQTGLSAAVAMMR